MFSIIGSNLPRKKIWIVCGSVLFITIVFVIIFLIFRTITIRQFEALQATQSNNTIFFGIEQKPFHIIRGLEDRKYITLENVSRKLQMAVVAIEDGRFFQHFGFDPIRMARVVVQLLKRNAPLQGASTITQQLVKLTLLSPEITLSRKIKEIFMATALETKYSKAQILEFYLNKVYLGLGNYGVENASLNYFHKPTTDLTLAESAFIAGLIKKPEGYSPFINLKKARQRQVLALKRMRILGWITRQEYQTAINEKILIRQRKQHNLQAAPYFVNHILLQLKQKYGHKMVYGGGLRIYTTLDQKMQQVMKQIIDNRLSQPRSFEEVAGVSIDPVTGFVKALIGGADFYKSEFNRATQAKRQPGSSFKPILYSAALANGIKSNDVFLDEPTQYNRLVDDEIETYGPQNFSGEHLGPITVSYALRNSNNVVSVKILDKIGIKALIQISKLFGIELPGKRGLCLALGCGETTLLQLTNAYGVFATQGYRSDPVFVLKITDRKGNVIESYQQKANIQVLSHNQAFQMNRMLQDVVNSGTGRNAKIGRPSGGKTGTSDQYRDAWYIGFTSDLVTGFWIGNDDNEPMDGELGGKTPARLWRSFMQSLPAVAVQKSFPINENFEEYLICDNSGQLATSFCTSATWYALQKPSQDLTYCDMHADEALELKICQISGKLATQYCPVGEIITESYSPGTEPEEFCDIHVADTTFFEQITGQNQSHFDLSNDEIKTRLSNQDSGNQATTNSTTNLPGEE